MLNKKQYFKTVEELTAFAEKSTFKTLADLNARNYSEMIASVIASSHNHKVATSNPHIVEQIADLEAEHNSTLADLDTARQELQKITLTDEEREIWSRKADSLKAEADRQTSDKKDLEKITQTISTDFSDLVQVWLISYLYDEPSDKHIATALDRVAGIENEEEAEATAEHIARVKTAKASVNRYIRQQASVNGLDTFHTIKTEATAEQVSNWIAQGKSLDEKYPIGRTESYESMTQDTDGKYYHRIHYKTVKQGNSLEQMNENGDITGYIRTSNSYIEDIGTLERLEELLQRALWVLTDKQREFIQAFCSVNARIKEQEARNEYYKEHFDNATASRKMKDFRQRVSNTGYKARVDHAFNYVGIYSQSRRNNFLTALKKNLKPFQSITTEELANEREQLTLAPYQNFKRYESMVTKNRGIREPKPQHTDLLAWTSNSKIVVAADSKLVTWLTHEEATAKAQAQAQAMADLQEQSNINTDEAQWKAVHKSVDRHNRKVHQRKQRAYNRRLAQARTDLERYEAMARREAKAIGKTF